MFIAEAHLYIDYLKEQIAADVQYGQFDKKKKYYTSFCQNLRDGINYYRRISVEFQTDQEQFIDYLNHADIELDLISYQYSIINSQVQAAVTADV
jgi:transcription initiation factor TFIID subunit TAF12